MSPNQLTDVNVLFNQNILLEQLHQWCSINSGSTNLSGLAQMHEQLTQAYTPLCDQVESIPLPSLPIITMAGDIIQQEQGHALLIRKRPHLTRRVLLSGHMDTVFDAHHPFQHLRQLNANTINGPGVADMKGGLIVMLHSLQAFEQSDDAKLIGWDVIINPDEELGSPASSALLTTLSRSCQAALVYEPSMTPDGVFAKNRKGSAKVTLIATGKSAHAGRNFNDGRNAICYLADVITAIHALNDQRTDVTLNVGKIAGGTALNTVPDKAVAKIDIRIGNPEDEAWVRAQLNRIAKAHQREGYTLQLDIHFGRPVKRVNPATERLFLCLQQSAKQLGLTLSWKDSGGCCDGNNLAQQGLAVIDTLGVRGGNLHTADEFILIDSLVERCALSYWLLKALAQGALEQINLTEPPL